jgi:integrase
MRDWPLPLHGWGACHLVTSIDSQIIYKYRNHVGDTRSKTIANRDLECLSHVFTIAIEWGVAKGHPMTGKQVTKYSLDSRDRYVEDWELQEWAKVANPFLIAYAQLKGVTGLRQQDMLTLARKNITEPELISVNIKTGKKLRFPLYTKDGKPSSVKLALDDVEAYYRSQLQKKINSRHPQALPPVVNSPWVFYTRKGESYYDMEKRRAPGFKNIWGRSMKKALEQTALTENFREHDLRAKVASDLDTDIQAQEQLAHSDAKVTKKHYRRRGTVVAPAKGFFGSGMAGSE